MSHSKAMQECLQQVIVTLEDTIHKVQHDFLSNVSLISTPDEQHDFIKVLQESIFGDFKVVWKILSGKELNVLDITNDENTQPGRDEDNAKSSVPDVTEDVDSEGDTSLEHSNNKISKEENTVNTNSKESEDSGGDDDDDDDDDDVTIFEIVRSDKDSVKNENEAPTVNENLDNQQDIITSNDVQNDKNSTIPPVLPVMKTNDIQTENSRTPVQTDDATLNDQTPDFQDTPTSVSDFRYYNTNKETCIPFDINSPNTTPDPVREKVMSYLNSLPSVVDMLPVSEETISTNTLEGSNDDNISSVSHFNSKRTQNIPKAVSTKETTIPETPSEENKENSVINNSNEGVTQFNNESVKVAKPTEKDKQTKSDHINDMIHIQCDKKQSSNKCPTSINTEENASEIFHVGEIVNEQTMSCASESLLKNNTKPGPPENVSLQENSCVNIEQEPEQKLNSNIMNNSGAIENIDLTLDEDSNDEESTLESPNNFNNNNTDEAVATDMISQDTPKRPDENIDKILDSDDEEVVHLPDKSISVPKESQPNVINPSMKKEPSKNSTEIQSQNCKTNNIEKNIYPQKETSSRENDSGPSQSSHVLKREPLDIMDDHHQENKPQGSSICTGERSVKEESEDAYDVIPSDKVEVVMKEENNSEVESGENDYNMNYEATTSGTNGEARESNESSTPLPRNKKTSDRCGDIKNKKTGKRKKCELGIMPATGEEVLQQINSKKLKVSSRRPGPKSKTKGNTDLATPSNDLSQEINNLINLKSLDKPKTSGKGNKCKNKKRKKVSLLDYYDENENLSSISQDSRSNLEKERQNQVINCIRGANRRDIDEITRNAILQSDIDDHEDYAPPIKQKRSETSPKHENPTSKSQYKEIPSWKKNPLLTANINPPTSKTSSVKVKSKAKTNVSRDDDDVRSVCTSIQERIRDPTVRENLKKLFDARKTIVPAISQVEKEIEEICISSSDEEEENEHLLSDDDDLNSVLNEVNQEELNSKFKTTAKLRKKRVSSLQRRAGKILSNSQSNQDNSSQESVTFEDRYKDTPRRVLDIDEETGEMVTVCPFYSKILKEHQKRGLQFMWDICFGSRKKILSEKGSGCILAHDMGLGKSLQVIVLLHTLKCMENMPPFKILIVSPKSLVQNWEDEITKWTKGLQVRLNVYTWTTDKAVEDIHEWNGNGGVYIIGYQMFVAMCKKTQPVDMRTFFLCPGPDVIICDEAHLLKNNKTETHKWLTQIQTRRRIALTGTPIQNNLQELYNIVSFVQPDFMRKDKFHDQFIHPISLSQNVDASRYERSKATERITVLHKELEKVMDREQGSTQEVGLPPKLNYDIFLNLTDIQKKLYKFFCNKMKDCFVSPMIFPSVRLAENISIHPKTLESSKRVEELCKGKDWNEELKKGNDWHADLKGDWWKNVLNEKETNELNALETGVKIKVAFHILNYAASRNEKVLIFCQSLQVLDLIQTYLEQDDYVKNVNYFRLDFQVPISQRTKYIDVFNDENNTDAKVFLMTHKVGGLGLNFTGANRVIIIDMPWNPSYHEQSSNRTHRLGQKKTSFIYRLITKGTLEEKVYKTTVSKQSLSMRVVDRKKIKSMLREKGTFQFHFEESKRVKDLPYAKDDLLNSFLLDSDINGIIHSYAQQGELFELSEEFLNEAQAYEEYLMESRSLEVPGETKRRRRRKLKTSPVENEETLPDNMMSRKHIETYNHAELLKKMHEPSQGKLMPPPPLVPIRRKPKITNDPVGNQTPVNIPINKSLTDIIPSTTHVKPNSLPPNETSTTITFDSQTSSSTQSRYSSLQEFITSKKQAMKTQKVKEKSDDISEIVQKLNNNGELQIIKRTQPLAGNSTEDQATKEVESLEQPVTPQTRLFINPNIFKHSQAKGTPSTPTDQIQQGEQQKPPSSEQKQQAASSQQKLYLNKPLRAKEGAGKKGRPSKIDLVQRQNITLNSPSGSEGCSYPIHNIPASSKPTNVQPTPGLTHSNTTTPTQQTHSTETYPTQQSTSGNPALSNRTNVQNRTLQSNAELNVSVRNDAFPQQPWFVLRR
ncbi:hypothetical protein M8J76_003963 [Diaphorina citri]|nr:hypothetical protein M8J76_003963 [Diaphorina citri]